MWPDPKGPNNIYGNIGSGIEMKPVLEFTFNIYCNTGPVNSRKPVLSSAVLLTSGVYFLVCALPCTHYIEGWRKFFSCPLDISIQSRWDCRTWKFEMGPPVTGILELDSAGLFLCETSPGGTPLYWVTGCADQMGGFLASICLEMGLFPTHLARHIRNFLRSGCQMYRSLQK